MAISAERFAQGMTYEAYKAQMTRNQERFATNEHNTTLKPEDVAFFKGLSQPLNVAVIAEDWCGDVIDNLPILGRIAQEAGTLNIRVFLRDQNLDVMDQYLKDGQFRSIPVFVFLDEHFHELGHFIERPASVTERREARRQALYAQHPEFGSPETPVTQLSEDARAAVTNATAAMRQELKPVETQDVVQAVREIVHKGAPSHV